jgi:NADPH:quinone reductase-like Zn-dependent oxidoreductase
MKAIVLHQYGGPELLRYEDYPDPKPGAGEVLVRVAATSVNPFDLKIRSGSVKDWVPFNFPGILGLDVSGTVEAVGPDVKNFAKGDKVFAHTYQTYASLCVVKASDLAKIPDGLDVVNAAALPTVTTTGAQLATLALSGKKGLTVLVTGAAGNVGRSAVFTAKQVGATVIAGVLRKQLDQEREIGADRVIALDDEAALNSLEKLDAVADTVSGPTAERLIAKVKDGGIFASVLAAPSNASAFPKVSVKTMQVASDPEALSVMGTAVKAGKLSIPLGQRFALKDASKAHAAAEKGASGKILLLA